jgi:hypothetical protein
MKKTIPVLKYTQPKRNRDRLLKTVLLTLLGPSTQTQTKSLSALDISIREQYDWDAIYQQGVITKPSQWAASQWAVFRHNRHASQWAWNSRLSAGSTPSSPCLLLLKALSLPYNMISLSRTD